VLVWEQGGCWPGADCTEDVAGYNVYELTPQGEVLRKSTEHKDQKAAVFAPPSWPEAAGSEHCFVVRGYTELGFESPPSNIGCYTFGQLGANKLQLYPESILWRFNRAYEDCSGNYGTGAYYPAAENPPYGAIVAGYEHSTAHCDFWNIAYRGGVWFDVSQIPGSIAYARLSYDWVGGIYSPAGDVATNEQISCASNLMLGTQDWRGDPYGDQPITIPAADYTPLAGGSPISGGYSIDVTSAVKAWLDGSSPNYGFVLRGPQENTSGDHGNSRCASLYGNFMLEVSYFGQ
jgi:hypothetical protein